MSSRLTHGLAQAPTATKKGTPKMVVSDVDSPDCKRCGSRAPSPTRNADWRTFLWACTFFVGGLMRGQVRDV